MTEPRSLEEWGETIRRDVASHRVLIYAKGEKNAAACGFSHRVMQVFNQLGVEFEVRNVFADPRIRPALCAFTDWPTIPQVFVDGRFIGGCDIVTEMAATGELQTLLERPSA